MPPSLAAKFAGLPRWAWLAILAGGLTIGLIMRSREKATSGDQNAGDITDTGLTDNGDGTFTDANGNIVDANGNLLDGYDPNSFSQYGGTIPYPPGSGSSSTTFQTPAPVDPRVPCTKEPPTSRVQGYTWVCRGGYWEMTPVAGDQGTPCDQNPPRTAPTGYHWDCRGNRWELIIDKPTPKPRPGPHAGQTPCFKVPGTPPKGYAWKCVSGYWQLEPVHAPPPPEDKRTPCATGKPPYDAPDGYHWVCKSGYWEITANHKGGKGGGDGRGCGKRPKHNAPQHHHWECKHGKWVPVKNDQGGHGRGNGNGGHTHAPVVTGGGAPARRDIHFPGGSGVIAGK